MNESRRLRSSAASAVVGLVSWRLAANVAADHSQLGNTSGQARNRGQHGWGHHVAAKTELSDVTACGTRERLDRSRMNRANGAARVTAVAAAVCVVGLYGFARRDLRG